MVSARTVRISQHVAHAGEGWLGLGVGQGNVHEVERLASGVGGAALALFGLKRGGPAGLALALVGGAFVLRGATGHCNLYHALGVSTAEPDRGKSSSVPARRGARVERAVTI